MTVVVAPPTRVPPLDGLDNPFRREWRNYLQTLQSIGQASPQILQETALVDQTAAIVTTPITLPAISAGFYRISVYYVVKIAAAVSSNLQVTISWTDNGFSSSRIIPALANGATGDNGGLEFPIHTDDNSPISYAVSYASNPANQMAYDLGVIVEALGA